jgi:hypothetical protein
MFLVTSVACAAPLHIDVSVTFGLLHCFIHSFSSNKPGKSTTGRHSRSSSFVRARICDVAKGEDIGISWIVDLECFQGLDETVVFDRAG